MQATFGAENTMKTIKHSDPNEQMKFDFQKIEMVSRKVNKDIANSQTGKSGSITNVSENHKEYVAHC